MRTATHLSEGGNRVHASLHVDSFIGLVRVVGWALLCHARARISSFFPATPPRSETHLPPREHVPATDPRLWN